MIRKEKIEKVAVFQAALKDKALIFMDYNGINVEEFSRIREELREDGNSIKVFRNTLLKKALAQIEVQVEAKKKDAFFSGMIATAIFSQESFIGGGKPLIEAEKQEFITIKGGLFEGNLIKAELARKYVCLPSKEALISMLVGALGAITSNFVSVLQEVQKQKELGEKTQANPS